MPRLIFALATLLLSSIAGAEINIRDFGATPDDKTDDTQAIVAALAACAKAGGGSVYVPSGTYIISRQGRETPILELPSNTTIRGDGAASILKFDAKVNQTNFWRMIGASLTDARNVTIRDLHLDGSSTHLKYEPGMGEQDHGVFFGRKDGNIQSITVRDCLIENFGGDCVSISMGCRNVSVVNVTVRNFLRQGIQLAGDLKARGYLVTGCQDLEGEVTPMGSTIHVEHARGLTNVILTNNRCLHSLMAGGVDGLVIRDNVIDGLVVCNTDTNTIFAGNIVRGDAKDDRPLALARFGYADGLVIKDNLFIGRGGNQSGIYVWGGSRYNPEPSKNVQLVDNQVRVAKESINLNGVRGGIIRDNLCQVAAGQTDLIQKRCEAVTVVSRPTVAAPASTQPSTRPAELAPEKDGAGAK